jgi:hypothetical protein
LESGESGFTKHARLGAFVNSCIVFLGPSLPSKEAKNLLKADFRAPARQGDVFLALKEKPRVIVLIDGVFGAAPSVWHHEIRAAKASGVKIFGAASMGALRAAELPDCITPIGLIAQKYSSGEWNDDADVALLHSDSTTGYQSLSLPQVNVWATLTSAVRKKLLNTRECDALISLSQNIFYQDRTWGRVLELAPLKKRTALTMYVQSNAVDQKALDTKACLTMAARFMQGKPRESAEINTVPFSSFVRRNRIGFVAAHSKQREAIKTLLLAHMAILNGLVADAEDVAEKLKILDLAGLSRDEAFRLAEVLVLEDMVLTGPERFFPDGPSELEAKQLASLMKSR